MPRQNPFTVRERDIDQQSSRTVSTVPDVLNAYAEREAARLNPYTTYQRMAELNRAFEQRQREFAWNVLLTGALEIVRDIQTA